MAKLTSAELKQGLDTYRKQAETQGFRVLAAGLSGRVYNGSMTEAEKAALLQQYTETLAKLTDNQTKLLEEYSKTERVNMTTFSNLISNYAKMTAAAYGAQGAENSATINAYSDRLTQLDNEMSRFGRGMQADLGSAFKESAASTKGFMDSNGKVKDPAGLAATLIGDLRNLEATNPKMIIPYVNTVEGSLGINLDDFLSGTAIGAGQMLADQPQAIKGYLASGIQADEAAAANEAKISEAQFEAASNLIRMTGTPQSKKYLDDVLVIWRGVKAETGGKEDVSDLPPPPPEATPEQRADWVNKVSNGRLSLQADGHVHETGDGAPDVMSYDQFVSIHGPGGGFKIEQTMKPYLAETRDRILKEMDRITNSTDRSDLETKAHIMGSEAFKKYAGDRGYSIADPDAANQTFQKLMAERKLQITRNRADQNMVEDINKMTGIQDASPLGVLAANVRHGLRSVLHPQVTNPSAVVTNGAQTPAEVAPEISESSTATTEAKSKIVEPTTHEGPGGWIYRVNGSKVQLVGRNPEHGKTNATPEKPIDLSPPQTATALKELGIKTPVEEASPVEKLPEAVKAAPIAVPEDAPEEGAPEIDAEVGSDTAEAPVAEAPVAEAPIPNQIPSTPEERRQKRLTTLGEARQQAMERTGAEQPEAGTTTEGKKADPAAVVKSMLGTFGGGYERAKVEPLAIPGLEKQPAAPGAQQGASVAPETPEDKLAPISRRRRFELLRGLEQ
jgi:hypothetical protein